MHEPFKHGCFPVEHPHLAGPSAHPPRQDAALQELRAPLHGILGLANTLSQDRCEVRRSTRSSASSGGTEQRVEVGWTPDSRPWKSRTLSMKIDEDQLFPFGVDRLMLVDIDVGTIGGRGWSNLMPKIILMYLLVAMHLFLVASCFY